MYNIKYRRSTIEKLRNIEKKLHKVSKKLKSIENLDQSLKKPEIFEDKIIIENEYFNNSFDDLKPFLNLLKKKKMKKKRKSKKIKFTECFFNSFSSLNEFLDLFKNEKYNSKTFDTDDSNFDSLFIDGKKKISIKNPVIKKYQKGKKKKFSQISNRTYSMSTKLSDLSNRKNKTSKLKFSKKFKNNFFENF